MKAKINKIIRLIRNLITELIKKPVIINASLSIDSHGEVYHSNWGDDINSFFLKEISKRPIILYHECLLTKILKKENYVVIGSTIDMLVNSQSIIWGAGLMNEYPKKLVKPQRICAVRGPKTREILLTHGIQCPPIYGDPALLLPLYYRPKSRKKYRIGIIPHYTEKDFIPEQISTNSNIHYIKIQGYLNWLDFIEEVYACEYIISSSLHGLIIAEAYKIPSKWIEFKDAPQRSRFKYHDFYASINKKAQPYIIDETTTIESLLKSLHDWVPGHLNIEPLIKSCPFELNLSINFKEYAKH